MDSDQITEYFKNTDFKNIADNKIKAFEQSVIKNTILKNHMN